jgi:hypothetical protein
LLRLACLSCLGSMFCVFWALLASTCQAESVFSLSLNTAPLVGNANAPFSIDFQFTDGSGIGDTNNTATLSAFNFSGGGASGSPTLTGGAAGSLGSTVTLTDSSFFNEFFQEFTPGSTLRFTVNLTTNVDAGGTPDEFSFALLDKNLIDIPTTSATNAFLVVDITSANPSLQIFAAMAPYSAIGAPALNLSQATPESGVLSLLAGLAISGVGFGFRHRCR